MSECNHKNILHCLQKASSLLLLNLIMLVLFQDKAMTVYVESNVIEETVVKEDESFQETKQKLVVCGKGNIFHFNILCTSQKRGAWSFWILGLQYVFWH